MFPFTFSIKSPAHKARVPHHILPYKICRVTNIIKARPILIGFLRCKDRSDRPERTSDRTRPGDIQDRPIKDRPGLRVQMKQYRPTDCHYCASEWNNNNKKSAFYSQSWDCSLGSISWVVLRLCIFRVISNKHFQLLSSV